MLTETPGELCLCMCVCVCTQGCVCDYILRIHCFNTQIKYAVQGNDMFARVSLVYVHLATPPQQ
jgi:hypothetical protein